jgi:trimeric autotransporter adhesin
MRFCIVCVVVGFLSLGLLAAQTASTNPPASSASAPVPRLIRFTGIAKGATGTPMTGALGITFSLYQEQQGGAPLWLETQNVQPDTTGHYSVMLGSTTSQGLPSGLFVSGQARWLGVQPQGQPEQPRIMLMSVPYALKAGDAQTIGGLPPSAFVLAAPPNGSTGSTTTGAASPSPVPSGSSDVTTSGGKPGTIPFFNTATDIENSVITQTGTGNKAKVGINTTTPASTLDVKGAATIRGLLSLPATGTATTTQGYNSQPAELSASVFNTGAGTALAQNFEWQAEPVGNDTATTSGTLNLLFATGSNKFAETGLNIASNGQITFANAQTFPIPNGGVSNAMLANSSLTVNAGTALTGGGAVSLGGNTTLNVDTTKVPLLASANTFTANQTVQGILSATSLAGNGAYVTNVNASQLGGLAASAFAQLATNNTFTGNQTVNGNLSATGVVTGSSYQIGSNHFDMGSVTNNTALLGFAGNPAVLNASGDTGVGWGALSSDSGGANTAVGWEALNPNTTGIGNTASGFGALQNNTTGSYNTALGFGAGYSYNGNLTGSGDTAVGFFAGFDDSNGTLSNATAIGNNAVVSESNALVLGCINGVNFCTAGVSVGIGEASPSAPLHITGPAFAPPGYLNGPDNGLLLGSNGTSSYKWIQTYGGPLTLNPVGNQVGIATEAPTNIFTIGKGAGQAIADGWTMYSSRRWKTNIQTLNGSLAKVERLRGVSYDSKGSGKHEVGLIAEEVGKVVPEVVTYEENGKDARGVDYSRLTALLIEATKEQQALIHKQQEQIKAQHKQMAAQQAQLIRLTSQVRAIQTSLQTSGGNDGEIRRVKTQASLLPTGGTR